MTHALASSDRPGSIVFERRPRWSKEADVQPSAAEGQGIDAHRREATIAFSVFSWTSVRAAVTGCADAQAQGTSPSSASVAPEAREETITPAGD